MRNSSVQQMYAKFGIKLTISKHHQTSLADKYTGDWYGGQIVRWDDLVSDDCIPVDTTVSHHPATASRHHHHTATSQCDQRINCQTLPAGIGTANPKWSNLKSRGLRRGSAASPFPPAIGSGRALSAVLLESKTKTQPMLILACYECHRMHLVTSFTVICIGKSESETWPYTTISQRGWQQSWGFNSSTSQQFIH